MPAGPFLRPRTSLARFTAAIGAISFSKFTLEDTMPLVKPGEGLHHYNGSEAFVQNIPMADGMTKRYRKFKINTLVIKPDGHRPDSTPWVFIPVDDLEQISAQFAATAESAKRWVAGSDFETMGEDIGVLNTTHKHS